jgi:hypothetical protein
VERNADTLNLIRELPGIRPVPGGSHQGTAEGCRAPDAESAQPGGGAGADLREPSPGPGAEPLGDDGANAMNEQSGGAEVGHRIFFRERSGFEPREGFGRRRWE